MDAIGFTYREKIIKLLSHCTSHTKVIYKWIEAINMKSKTLKLLEETEKLFKKKKHKNW